MIIFRTPADTYWAVDAGPGKPVREIDLVYLKGIIPGLRLASKDSKPSFLLKLSKAANPAAPLFQDGIFTVSSDCSTAVWGHLCYVALRAIWLKKGLYAGKSVGIKTQRGILLLVGEDENLLALISYLLSEKFGLSACNAARTLLSSNSSGNLFVESGTSTYIIDSRLFSHYFSISNKDMLVGRKVLKRAIDYPLALPVSGVVVLGATYMPDDFSAISSKRVREALFHAFLNASLFNILVENKLYETEISTSSKQALLQNLALTDFPGRMYQVCGHPEYVAQSINHCVLEQSGEV